MMCRFKTLAGKRSRQTVPKCYPCHPPAMHSHPCWDLFLCPGAGDRGSNLWIAVDQPGPSVEKKFHIHLVSDSTGETLNALANACLAQFENVDVQIHFYALVRGEHQLAKALDHIAIAPGLVFFTLANQDLREKLVARCDSLLIDCVDVMDAPVT